MKNLKNTISAAGLMAVLVFGTVSANAGFLVSDRTANATPEGCAAQSVLTQAVAGIMSAFSGIILIDRAGFLVSDKQSTSCQQAKDGILVSDRNGILVSD